MQKIENESKKTFLFHVRLTPIFLWGKRYLVGEKVSVLQSVRLISVLLIEDLLWEFDLKFSVPKDSVRLKEVSALYHVRFRQIPLYKTMNFSILQGVRKKSTEFEHDIK